MELLDGKKVSEQVLAEIAQQVSVMKGKGLRAPHLVAVLVGSDGASETYVNSKVKHCGLVGFESTLLRYEADITEAALLDVVHKLNADDNV
ncbi:MAG TPA: tetrahydrofolate dehydrogenase/cyclohydrolase catalytic domain-containing protein, partial [Cytophagales bacterium]|nr:tetrahydrofolate dehydrogenase/cyclohydrolase catalytic domain-containing protein [Cytophagales bacterium]